MASSNKFCMSLRSSGVASVSIPISIFPDDVMLNPLEVRFALPRNIFFDSKDIVCYANSLRF